MTQPFIPTQIPSLAGWWEPSMSLGNMTQDYTGSAGAVGPGSTAVASNADPIGFLPDLSGNNAGALGLSGSTRPTYNTLTNGMNNLPCMTFAGASSQTLNLGTPVILENLQYQSFTLTMVYEDTGTATTETLFSKATSGDANFFFISGLPLNSSNRQFARFATAWPNYNLYTTPVLVNTIVTYRFTKLGYYTTGGGHYLSALEEIFYNGQLVFSQQNCMINQAWPSYNWRIGSTDTPASFFYGKIGAITLYNRAITDAEREQVESYMAKYGAYAMRQPAVLPQAPQTTNLIIAGNSLTYSTNGYGRGWVVQTKETKVSELPINIKAHGIGGISTSTMIIIAPQSEDLLLIKGMLNILIFWEITNDLTNTLNGTTSYNNVVTYCNARKAAGWDYVICMSCLPRGATMSSTFETQRAILNGDLRTDSPTAVPAAGALIYTGATYCDYLFDIGNDPTIGQAGDQLNTTYYGVDDTHLTPAGYSIVAGYAQTLITWLYQQKQNSFIGLTQPDFTNIASNILVTPSNLLATDSSGRVSSNATQIGGSTSAATRLGLSAATIISGAVTGSPTSTSFIDTSLSTYSTTGALIGRVVYFNSGALNGQVQAISAYNGSTQQVTVSSAFTGAPSNGDTYLII